MLLHALDDLLTTIKGALVAACAPPDLYEAVTKHPRTRDMFLILSSEEWSLEWGSLADADYAADNADKVLTFDVAQRSPAFASARVEEAMRYVFFTNHDLRRGAISREAKSLLANAELTEMEAMARTYGWSGWFWDWHTGVVQDAEGLLADMLVVFGDGTPGGLDPSTEARSPYYVWRGKKTSEQADSTGFKEQYREVGGNQVRHSSISLYISFTLGKAGYLAAQLRESMACDVRLNLALYQLAEMLNSLDPAEQVQSLPQHLRQVLGDPTQTAPFVKPSGPMPKTPTFPLWGIGSS